MLLDLLDQIGMIQIIGVDINRTPMTAVVVLDGDDAQAIFSGKVLFPKVRGRRFTQHASLTGFLAICRTVILHVKRAVGSIIARKQLKKPFGKVHSSAS